jgi:hypothetical protein
MYVAERIARPYDAHDGEAVQRNALELALLNPPAENGQIADEVDFRVREARSGENVRRAGLDVVAAQLRPIVQASRAQRAGEAKGQNKSLHAYPPI